MNPAISEQILTIISRVPEGSVTSYGRIAEMTDGATARMVARALRLLPKGHSLPWQRVITSTGKIADHSGAHEQRELLMAEGVIFDANNRVLKKFWWP